MEGKPGQTLADVWTPAEAIELLAALSECSQQDPHHPGWHTHLGHDTSELTIAVGERDARKASP
jgi:hypothetical protein